MQTTKLISLVAVIFLTGCAAPILLTGLGAASLATNETTGKTITDHTVSSVSGQDCRVLRAFKDQSVCQPNIPESKVTTTGVTPTSVAELEIRYRQSTNK